MTNFVYVVSEIFRELEGFELSIFNLEINLLLNL
jgi:hypothetical protein